MKFKNYSKTEEPRESVRTLGKNVNKIPFPTLLPSDFAARSASTLLRFVIILS